jgi:protein XRP2
VLCFFVLKLHTSLKLNTRTHTKTGSLNGEQFCIEECSDCEIYALDHNTSVTIDQCVNCKIYIGPCDSSVFVRDCKDCQFMIVCQQFRARTLANCQLWLFSTTEPVLEISPDLKIACFNVGYPELGQHLDKAKLNMWNNRYSEVHNFTPEHPFVVLSSEEQFSSEALVTQAYFRNKV